MGSSTDKLLRVKLALERKDSANAQREWGQVSKRAEVGEQGLVRLVSQLADLRKTSNRRGEVYLSASKQESCLPESLRRAADFLSGCHVIGEHLTILKKRQAVECAAIRKESAEARVAVSRCQDRLAAITEKLRKSCRLKSSIKDESENSELEDRLSQVVWKRNQVKVRG